LAPLQIIQDSHEKQLDGLTIRVSINPSVADGHMLSIAAKGGADQVEVRSPDHLNEQENDVFRRVAGLPAHATGTGHMTEGDRAYAE